MDASENRQAAEVDNADEALFVLTSQLTIADVERVQEQLEHWVTQSGQLVVDTAALEKIDTAGIQLLCSLKKTLDGSGVRLQWRGIAPALGNAASQFGLLASLGLPAAAIPNQ